MPCAPFSPCEPLGPRVPVGPGGPCVYVCGLYCRGDSYTNYACTHIIICMHTLGCTDKWNTIYTHHDKYSYRFWLNELNFGNLKFYCTYGGSWVSRGANWTSWSGISCSSGGTVDTILSVCTVSTGTASWSLRA